jgi:CBS domain-containing protein
MKVKDVMTTQVVTVAPETRIGEVAEILFKNRFHGLPVVEKDKVVGIITESDFFTKDARNVFLPSYISFLQDTKIADALTTEKQKKVEQLMNTQAADIMNPSCTTILEDMDIKDLLNFFRETHFITLPVVDQSDQLVGVVTLADILGLIKAD